MTFLLPSGIKGLTDQLETGNADKMGDFVIFHIMFQKHFQRESMKRKNNLEKDGNGFEMAINF